MTNLGHAGMTDNKGEAGVGVGVGVESEGGRRGGYRHKRYGKPIL